MAAAAVMLVIPLILLSKSSSMQRFPAPSRSPVLTAKSNKPLPNCRGTYSSDKSTNVPWCTVNVGRHPYSVIFNDIITLSPPRPSFSLAESCGTWSSSTSAQKVDPYCNYFVSVWLVSGKFSPASCTFSSCRQQLYIFWWLCIRNSSAANHDEYRYKEGVETNDTIASSSGEASNKIVVEILLEWKRHRLTMPLDIIARQVGLLAGDSRSGLQGEGNLKTDQCTFKPLVIKRIIQEKQFNFICLLQTWTTVICTPLFYTF